MTESSQIARLQNVVVELRQDLGAHQKELSSKTKKLVEMENVVSSLKLELNKKTKELDELRITSKISHDNRTDEMHLEIEEYKNQIHSKDLETKQIRNEFNRLQRAHQILKQQFDAIQFKNKQTENEYNLRLNRMDTRYKQKIETLKRMHSTQIKQSQDQIEAIKQKQLLSSTQETEDIKKQLMELKESHERIEADLNTQIEDLKDQSIKREKEKEQLIKELNQLSDNYKKYAQNEIEKLKNQLQRYQQGDIEIVLKIEVDDPIIHKPPPRKPAPPKPFNQKPHSRQSSNASSTHSNDQLNDQSNGLTILPPISPTTETTPTTPNGFGINIAAPTLENIKSNPEFFRDHSNPNSLHHKIHKTYRSQGNSAFGFIKNGVVSMWGSTPKTAQTPGPNGRSRYMSSAGPGSVGFPSTGIHGKKRNKRAHSNVSRYSNLSDDIFSDNLSIDSSGFGDKSVGSAKLSASDALSNKSLELQRKMLMQANTRLAEDLKNEKKNVMIVKEKAHRKYKQLQIQMQAEQRQWKLKEKELSSKLDKKVKKSKQDEYQISELQKRFQALEADYNIKLNSGGNQQQINNNNNNNIDNNNNNNNELILKIQALETNNRSLINQCEKYRRELSGLKQTILNCNDTMREQQNQILILNTQISELRKLNGFGGGSSEELLQKQIRLLKSQRRMLIQELKDLREQNEKLKNIIVTGQPPNTYMK